MTTPTPSPVAGLRAPSAFHLEQAMSIAQQALAAIWQDAELQDTDEVALHAAIHDAGADIRGLVLRLCLSAEEDGTNADACGQRQAVLADRHRRFKRHEEAKRAAVLGILQAMPELFPKGVFKDALLSVSVRTTKPGVTITDEAAVPDIYVRIKREPDKTAIRDDLLQGVVIDGAELNSPKLYITIRTA